MLNNQLMMEKKRPATPAFFYDKNNFMDKKPL